MLIPLSVPVLRCFNSIKVQLEQNITAAQLAKDMFQFHKGTIRTSHGGKENILGR